MNRLPNTLLLLAIGCSLHFGAHARAAELADVDQLTSVAPAAIDPFADGASTTPVPPARQTAWQGISRITDTVTDPASSWYEDRPQPIPTFAADEEPLLIEGTQFAPQVQQLGTSPGTGETLAANFTRSSVMNSMSEYGSTDAQAEGTCYSSEFNYLPVDSNYFIMPHYSYAEYGTDSVKSNAQIAGVYGYYSDSVDMFEFGIDAEDYRFNSGYGLQQQYYTIGYQNFWVPNWKFRVGARYLSSEDSATDNGWIYITGIHYYVLDEWDAGVDAYFSRYAHYDPILTVSQVNPHLGLQLNKATRIDLTGYYICLSKDIGLGELEFYSIDGRIAWNYDRWGFSLFGWVGEQTFAVRRDGYVVYNLSEEHEAGYGGEVTLKFGPQFSAIVRVSNEEFTDFTEQAPTNQLVTTVLFSYLF